MPKTAGSWTSLIAAAAIVSSSFNAFHAQVPRAAGRRFLGVCGDGRCGVQALKAGEGRRRGWRDVAIDVLQG